MFRNGTLHMVFEFLKKALSRGHVGLTINIIVAEIILSQY